MGSQWSADNRGKISSGRDRWRYGTVLDTDKVQHVVWLSGIDAPERKISFGSAQSNTLGSDLRQVGGGGRQKNDRYGCLVGKMLVIGRDANLAQSHAGIDWLPAAL